MHKIVSGGQTGADRGALDAAIDLGLEHGGYCPAGRRAEDGRVPDRYRMIEMPGSDYAERTERNVLESDGTLLVTRGPPHGGSSLTAALAHRHLRPFLHIDLARHARGDVDSVHSAIREWLAESRIQVLNVAGPREGDCHGIAQEVRSLLHAVLSPRAVP